MAMANPWEEISLSDYENHMRLSSVRQLQVMNELMALQFSTYPVTTAMVLGVAGGNGLEHIDPEKFTRVFGIDINSAYLAEAGERYASLGDILELRRLDLCTEAELLPQAELVIANLLVEYIGYEAFQTAVLKTGAKYVSCVIQINTDEEAWVSDSPYLHAFDGLDAVHHQMEEAALTHAMECIGYRLIQQAGRPLPNGKKLVMLDYMQ